MYETTVWHADSVLLDPVIIRKAVEIIKNAVCSCFRKKGLTVWERMLVLLVNWCLSPFPGADRSKDCVTEAFASGT
jgi:hypothetical protein